MAVEHGMGPKERAVDFCPYMTEVMYMNGWFFYLIPFMQGLLRMSDQDSMSIVTCILGLKRHTLFHKGTDSSADRFSYGSNGDHLCEEVRLLVEQSIISR